MKYVDLHLHTTYSDGIITPKNIVRMAKERGLGIISITDHDTFFGYHEAKDLAKEKGITLVPGVEMTTNVGHILALGFNPENKEFDEMLKRIRELQREITQERIELLVGAGIPISIEKVDKIFPHCSLGKYHLMRTLLLDEHCSNYFTQREIYLPHEKYRKTLSSGAVAGRVYRKIELDVFEAMEKVRQAEGISIIAHPSKHGRKPEDFKEVLKKVDGIEVQPRFKENARHFIEYAKAKGLLITYGSDLHMPSEGKEMLGRNGSVLENRVLERLGINS